MEPVPDFANLLHQHLRRMAWGDFPDVIIHAEESAVKKHLHYAAAKIGNASAAENLILETIKTDAINRIINLIGNKQPHLLAVHALETEGANAIPGALAQVLSKLLGIPVAKGVIQINRVSHTGAGGYHRLALPALFGGQVDKPEYFLVDDFIGQGGTLANLKGFVESRGASVIGATVLTGKAYSAKLRLIEETLQALGANMETNSNNGGLLPSAMALKDSLNPKLATSSEQTMLTPSQLELLQQFELEIDEYFAKSPRLDALATRIKTQAKGE